jgi:hypothetical protein
MEQADHMRKPRTGDAMQERSPQRHIALPKQSFSLHVFATQAVQPATAKRERSKSKMETTMSRLTALAMGVATALFLAAPGAIAPAAAAEEMFFSIGGPTPPPAPPTVVQPAMPHQGMVWHEGHYTWHDGHYAWVNGMWVEPPYHAAAWVPGHWIFRDGRNLWIDGHWEG